MLKRMHALRRLLQFIKHVSKLLIKYIKMYQTQPFDRPYPLGQAECPTLVRAGAFDGPSFLADDGTSR